MLFHAACPGRTLLYWTSCTRHAARRRHNSRDLCCPWQHLKKCRKHRQMRGRKAMEGPWNDRTEVCVKATTYLSSVIEADHIGMFTCVDILFPRLSFPSPNPCDFLPFDRLGRPVTRMAYEAKTVPLSCANRGEIYPDYVPMYQWLRLICEMVVWDISHTPVPRHQTRQRGENHIFRPVHSGHTPCRHHLLLPGVRCAI